tara:strand:- start:7773 stop:9296 length:1524 start_codon:yes stop_codon:yes gene_type:complete
MNKEKGPKNVLIFGYNIINWLYKDIIPILKKRYKSRIIIIASENVLLEFNNILDKDDIAIDHYKLTKSLKQGFGKNIDEERVLARIKEEEYNFSYMRDVIQQDRQLSTYFLSHSEKFIWTEDKNLNDDYIINLVNQCVNFSEKLLNEEEIDLALVWPMDFLSATIANIFESKNITVTYPYNSKYKNYGFWASSAFQDDKVLKEYYNSTNDLGLVPIKDITPPNTGWPATSEMDKIYSFRNIFKKVLKTTLFRFEFIFRDLLKLDFSKKDRIGYFALIFFQFHSWWIYKKITKNSFKSIDNIKDKPYLFYAISLEPEFSVQARCKEFNDQKAIIKQLALSLPIGYEIVIKEHFDIGRRGWSFYNDLCKIPNVRMAHPSIRGIDLVAESRAVATMAGTVTLEATLMGKNVIEFSNHSSFSFLPNVFTFKEFYNLPTVLRDVMAEKKDQEINKIRSYGARVRKAIINMSFDAPNSPLFYSNDSYKGLDKPNLDKAVKLLLDLFARNSIKK